MGIAGLILVPHLSKSGKSFLFYSCTSDVIVISQNSQRVKSYKNTQKPSSPGIQRFLDMPYLGNVKKVPRNFPDISFWNWNTNVDKNKYLKQNKNSLDPWPQ